MNPPIQTARIFPMTPNPWFLLGNAQEMPPGPSVRNAWAGPKGFKVLTRDPRSRVRSETVPQAKLNLPRMRLRRGDLASVGIHASGTVECVHEGRAEIDPI